MVVRSVDPLEHHLADYSVGRSAGSWEDRSVGRTAVPRAVTRESMSEDPSVETRVVPMVVLMVPRSVDRLAAYSAAKSEVQSADPMVASKADPSVGPRAENLADLMVASTADQ